MTHLYSLGLGKIYKVLSSLYEFDRTLSDVKNNISAIN